MRYASFDLETTGVDTLTSKPVQIGLHFSDTQRRWSALCNPGSKALSSPDFLVASEIHGITAEALEGAPTVDEAVALALEQLIDYEVLIGYNLVDFDLKITPTIGAARSVIDVMRLARLLAEECDPPAALQVRHPLGLAAFSMRLDVMYGLATGELLDGAHDAATDAYATSTVLEYLLGLYYVQRPDLVELASELRSPPYAWSGWDGTFKLKGSLWVCQIGKHKGKPIQHIPVDYLEWILKSDFSDNTKTFVQEHLAR
jgi:DNA polymerase III epsilon subunit-like protein